MFEGLKVKGIDHCGLPQFNSPVGKKAIRTAAG
jgi:hypothetical protein